MTRIHIWAAVVLALGFSTPSLARAVRNEIAVPAVHTTAPAVLSYSGVHDWNGQRYDVPPELLRRPGVLINGLPAGAEQFE